MPASELYALSLHDALPIYAAVPEMKMPKTGKKVTMQYAEIFKLKDGKVTQVWRFRNGVDMAMQLGLVEMPKGKAEPGRSEEHTSELQSQFHLVCRLLLEKK